MTNTTKKMTKTQMFADLLTIPAVSENPARKEFIEHEMELLAKKNQADKKPTATQVANEQVKDAIMQYMADGEKRTVTEIMKAIPSMNGFSNQKAGSLVRQLTLENRLVRTEVKGRALFSLPQ